MSHKYKTCQPFLLTSPNEIISHFTLPYTLVNCFPLFSSSVCHVPSLLLPSFVPNRAEGRRRKTAPCLARQLRAVLIHWFLRRTFVFLGDGGYASHELASICHRHQRHATLISRYHGDANLYAPPPPRTKRNGRPESPPSR